MTLLPLLTAWPPRVAGIPTHLRPKHASEVPRRPGGRQHSHRPSSQQRSLTAWFGRLARRHGPTHAVGSDSGRCGLVGAPAAAPDRDEVQDETDYKQYDADPEEDLQRG